MKPAESRELSDAQLVEKLKEMRAELFNLRFQMATSQLDNTCLLYTSPSPRDRQKSRMPSSA